MARTDIAMKTARYDLLVIKEPPMISDGSGIDAGDAKFISLWFSSRLYSQVSKFQRKSSGGLLMNLRQFYLGFFSPVIGQKTVLRGEGPGRFGTSGRPGVAKGIRNRK